MQETLEGRRGIGDRAAPELDALQVRHDFPILSTEFAGRPLVWLERSSYHSPLQHDC